MIAVFSGQLIDIPHPPLPPKHVKIDFYLKAEGNIFLNRRHGEKLPITLVPIIQYIDNISLIDFCLFTSVFIYQILFIYLFLLR